MKYIVAGSRDFTDYILLSRILSEFIGFNLDINADKPTIISGTAKGADKLGEKYAIDTGCHLIKMPADWDKLGKRAGYVRNQQMANRADRCIVFWDGESKGSKHMIDIAINAKIPTTVIPI